MIDSGTSGTPAGSAKPPQKKPHLGPYFGTKGKGKGNKGKKGNKNEEDETMEEDAVMHDMSDRLIKMSLNSAQRVRELEGAVMRCMAIPKDSFVDTRLAEAGTDYNTAVQGHPTARVHHTSTSGRHWWIQCSRIRH